jgi:hypothetical protein
MLGEPIARSLLTTPHFVGPLIEQLRLARRLPPLVLRRRYALSSGRLCPSSPLSSFLAVRCPRSSPQTSCRLPLASVSALCT